MAEQNPMWIVIPLHRVGNDGITWVNPLDISRMGTYASTEPGTHLAFRSENGFNVIESPETIRNLYHEALEAEINFQAELALKVVNHFQDILDNE